ncbi:hypothetical protein JOE66_000192 [Subtercola frigoramans]|uniref:Uncharacterized protein n=1 Tax=Subtercola frigoramans TaxID=120298 RepID=A0ABS2L0G3_9MICO|nr:hypothetical protein [Subtercola frigoramans]
MNDFPKRASSDVDIFRRWSASAAMGASLGPERAIYFAFVTVVDRPAYLTGMGSPPPDLAGTSECASRVPDVSAAAYR